MTVTDEEAMLLAHKKTTSSWKRLVVPAAVTSLALGAVIATTLSTRSSRAATSLDVICNDPYNPPPGCSEYVGCMGGIITDGNIRDSLQFWFQNRADCEKYCGHISTWDTSRVTDMKELFMGWWDFNDDIGAWDTSGVTDMSWMFNGARTFNQPIGGWDVSQVRDMENMFDCDGSGSMGNVGCGSKFNQPLSSWDISGVRVPGSFGSMFRCASSFDQYLGWCVEDAMLADGMFGRSGCDKTTTSDDDDGFIHSGYNGPAHRKCGVQQGNCPGAPTPSPNFWN